MRVGWRDAFKIGVLAMVAVSGVAAPWRSATAQIAPGSSVPSPGISLPPSPGVTTLPPSPGVTTLPPAPGVMTLPPSPGVPTLPPSGVTPLVPSPGVTTPGVTTVPGVTTLPGVTTVPGVTTLPGSPTITPLPAPGTPFFTTPGAVPATPFTPFVVPMAPGFVPIFPGTVVAPGEGALDRTLIGTPSAPLPEPLPNLPVQPQPTLPGAVVPGQPSP